MRTCRSCGRENPDESDFCSCGEYLRWEPTGYMPAASAAATPPSDPVAAAPPVAPADLDPNTTLAGDVGVSQAWPGGGAAPAGPSGHGDAPPGAAALMLRLPDSDAAAVGVVAVSVEPGQRATILGLIRNQSEVVDNLDLSIRGLPDDWWTVTPATAFLVPYGTAGTYEQEFQIHIHPPRTPQAQARPWSFEVVAESRAYGGEVAAAPATVTIGAYFEVTTELRPERASGRLKARYRLVVRNRANARTEIALSAEDTDAECQFRFAEPAIALEPGDAFECPFTVFPPSQIWVGKPLERRFQVTATPLGVDLPQPPRIAVFRQRAWLPRWLAIALPIVIALVVVAIKLMPGQAAVPNLKGEASVFAAQKKLTEAGFVLAPKTTAVVDPKQAPGSIADQSPPAGTKAKKGSVVSVAVFTGTGQATVPSVVGETPGLADQALRASSLALGAVSPQPLDPNGKISAQLPVAGAKVPDGTAVAVFLEAAAGASGASGATSTAGKGGAGAAAGAAGGAAGAAGGLGAAGGGSQGASGASGASSASGGAGVGAAAPVTIPQLSGDPTTAAAQLSQLGLTPVPVKRLAAVAVGQVAGTVPVAGSKVAKGAKVKLLISSGSPQLSYDDGQTIHLIDPLTDKPSGTVAPGTGAQIEASWSPDGTHIVYSQNGQLVLDQPNTPNAVPFQLTQAQTGIVNVNPSFAPTLKSRVLAFIQRGPGPTDAKLCFATVGKLALNADCTSAPGFDLGGQVAWSPDGSTILVLGTENNGANFGLVAFTSNVPFSAHASSWGQGTLQTDASTAGHGVFAGAFSPDGKQMALVANLGADDFSLYIVPAGNFNLTPAEELPVRACQLAWRPDGRELAVMQPNGLCLPTATGTIVAVKLANPRSPTVLATQAAHPAFQSIATNG